MKDTGTFFFVMPGLVPGIHVFGTATQEDVDGRAKPGHDARREFERGRRRQFKRMHIFECLRQT